MRPELAAARPYAEKTFRIIFCSDGGIIRSTTNRIASAGCAALKEGSCRLFKGASTTSPQCLDACWARRRFHARRTCARPSARLPANHARPDHPASGNRGNLLPEYPLLRIADLAPVGTPR